MEFSGIKKAIIDYSTEIEQNSQSVTRHFTGVANALSDLIVLEDKWTATNGKTIEDFINSIPDPAVKASYIGQLSLLRTQRTALITMLTQLDKAVTDAGLMLV